jgi:hypothetical protein
MVNHRSPYTNHTMALSFKTSHEDTIYRENRLTKLCINLNQLNFCLQDFELFPFEILCRNHTSIVFNCTYIFVDSVMIEGEIGKNRKLSGFLRSFSKTMPYI